MIPVAASMTTVVAGRGRTIINRFLINHDAGGRGRDDNDGTTVVMSGARQGICTDGKTKKEDGNKE
jgi:hypothetical protein